MTPIIICGVGGGLALILLIIGIAVTITSENTVVEKRLGQIVEAQEIQPERQRRQANTPLTDWINKQVTGSSLGDRISKNLARADIKMKSGEYIALMIISAFFTGFIIWFITGLNLILGVFGGIFGIFIPGFYVSWQQKRRLQRFDEQLGDMLNLMVNGLRAGYSTMQAMEAVSKELPAPICDEFRRVVQEMQLGVPMQNALENLLRRIPSDDRDLVITAINVQREVGGNLAEILDTISYTIRERVRIKGEIRVLTSQVMYSGQFLALMPVFVILILYALNREYMMEFFNPVNGICGYAALGLSAILIISGYFVMRKLAEIEV
ncbi:MAG: type II secretion system F family protein [Anaerolineae bacterium]|nr:type II secretion system F family protein [Anaerolineae bacterium]